MMHKLIVLITCLILPLLASSQKPSSDSTCCVPCKALKNALLVKAERDYLKDQINILRDSTRLQTTIINKQDSVMYTDSIKLTEYISREGTYNQLIGNKDREITIYKKKYSNQVIKARVAAGVSLTLFVTLLIVL